MSFPGALPSFTGFTAGHTLLADTHAAQHNLEQSEIVAIATKVGTGSSTPTANKVLTGNGVGTSSWSAVDLTSTVQGVLPAANGGTGVTTSTGSGAVVLGTAPTLSNPTITGGGSWAGSPILSTPIITDLSNSQHTHANAAQGGLLTHTGLPVGAIVQMVSTLSSAVATGTTIIPSDDTIPQNTEGFEVMTLSITPKSVTNILLILCKAWLSHASANVNLMAALFQDNAASALAGNMLTSGVGTGVDTVDVTHTTLAGTTSPTTFKVRVGSSSIGTVTFNGSGAASLLGGITKSSIVILECKA